MLYLSINLHLLINILSFFRLGLKIYRTKCLVTFHFYVGIQEQWLIILVTNSYILQILRLHINSKLCIRKINSISKRMLNTQCLNRQLHFWRLKIFRLFEAFNKYIFFMLGIIISIINNIKFTSSTISFYKFYLFNFASSCYLTYVRAHLTFTVNYCPSLR